MRDVYVEALKIFVENGHVQEKFEPDYLIAQLKSKGVLSPAEAEKILAKSSRLMRQKELLLDILANRGDNAFDSLLEAMDTEGYHWGRQLLEKMVSQEQKGQKQKLERVGNEEPQRV